MTQIIITNAGGTLNCNAMEWNERQVCNLAIRGVPLRTTGSFVDTGTYTLKNRVLIMTIRLSNAQKTTLQSIFDAVAVVTITGNVGSGMNWTYTGWFRRKPLVYEYSSQDTLREWVADLEFVLSSFDYSECSCPSGEQVTNGTFEIGDFTGWTTEGSPTVIHDAGYGHGGSDYFADFTEDVDKIIQIFDDIAVACINTFKLYAQGSGCWYPDLKVKIYYSDETDETVTFANIEGGWNECDVKPYLDEGKCVSKIEIWFYNVSGPCNGYVDDVTLVGSG